MSQVKYYKKIGTRIELNKIEGYYKSGEKRYEKNFRGEKRNGKWIYWYDDGEIDCTAMYKDGELIKKWIFYKIDGTIKEPISERIFIQGYEEYAGKSRYDYSGPIQEMNNRSSDSEESYVVSEGNYIYGYRDGLWTFYDENGNITSKGHHKHGKRDGEWIYYNEDGKISEQGVYKYSKEINKYGSSVRIGVWVEYFDDGSIKNEKNFSSKGKKDGKWTYYNEDGSIDKIVHYKDNQKIMESE